MKARIHCRKHKRRHSLHATMHCREGVKPGECQTSAVVDGVVTWRPRGERCPVWRSRKDAA